MCGIAGLIGKRVGLDETVRRMSNVLAHRGPDDEGHWCDPERGVAIGHRRLSIVDLSPQGHQPMYSASGRYVLAFNGEIYNHGLMRQDLEGSGRAAAWRGHSDTEVMLAAVEAWGVEEALRRSVGMFAIALWDRRENRLLLARDRIGEKPLYYGTHGGTWVFASELKAIRTLCASSPPLDTEALAQFMQCGYVPAPRSIYRDFSKLPAGHFVWLNGGGPLGAPVAYWALNTPATRQAVLDHALLPESQLLDVLHDRLHNAVGLQMVADVPLGAFLSGGIDSSLVVSLMQAQSTRPVRTFTIGFDDETYNEAPFAAAVAKHLGTDHTEMFVAAVDAEAVIPQLPTIYDEPFADPSQIPTILVSRLTRQHVTVSLSGDGGDELFAGYPRYALAESAWRRTHSLPRPVRRAVASALLAVSPRRWDALIGCLPGRTVTRLNGRRVHRIAHVLRADELGEMYARLMAQWQPEDAVVSGGGNALAWQRERWDAHNSPAAQMRRSDLGQYLPDDLMVKVDRAAMSVSLESRAPFLDHRVVELAFSLPDRMLMRNGRGKWALRQVLERYVPRSLVERPKAGFGIPLGDWLRGPLRSWATELLDGPTLRRQGFVNAAVVDRVWRQHQDGAADRSTLLWNVLMFQGWLGAQATPHVPAS
jgi:asparagine synthase (glutamine-hydrolysing)